MEFVSSELLAAGFSEVMGERVMTQAQFDVYKKKPQGRDAVAKKLTIGQAFRASYQRNDEEQEEQESQERRVREDLCIFQCWQIFVHMPSGQQLVVNIYQCNTIADLKRHIVRRSRVSIQTAEMRLMYQGKELSNNSKTLGDYGITNKSNITVLLRLKGGGPQEIFILDDSSRDPSHDFDFSKLTDDGKKYLRGPHQYYRPYGWTRCALKVTGKYGDDLWLGEGGIRTTTTPGEWSVSYHGTERENAQSISDEGFLLSKCMNFRFGKGIYSTPKISIAEGYAKIFEYNRRKYKIVFQNRCNPRDIKPVNNGDYWLTKDQDNIRPYGICLKCTDTGWWCTIL